MFADEIDKLIPWRNIYQLQNNMNDDMKQLGSWFSLYLI